jgi:hypothetical protein
MKHNRSRYNTLVTIIFPACLGIGTAIGALIHNIGLGLAIGAGVGTIFNLIGYYLVNSKADQDDLPRS